MLMSDISEPALERAAAKLKQLVPSAHKVEIQVIFSVKRFADQFTHMIRSAMSPRKPISRRQWTLSMPGEVLISCSTTPV